MVLPRESLFFLRAGDDILFFLDGELNVMVGDGEFSYTLNRIAQNSVGAAHPVPLWRPRRVGSIGVGKAWEKGGLGENSSGAGLS